MFILPARLRASAGAIAFMAMGIVIGCTKETAHVGEEDSTGTGSILMADDLLARSAAAHKRLTTLRATGFLRDARRGPARILPVRWMLAKPERCRLQIGEEVAIVLQDQWWSYRADAQRFRSHRLFTKTPVETAGMLLSDGVSFLLPSLFLRGESAFERDRFGKFIGWRLMGAGWLGAMPCYVFERHDATTDSPTVMRLYLDQESLLLRGWTLEALREDGSRRLLLEVRYTELLPNVTPASDAFQVRPPEPIPMTEDSR